jgi:hypothetical protein
MKKIVTLCLCGLAAYGSAEGMESSWEASDDRMTPNFTNIRQTTVENRDDLATLVGLISSDLGFATSSAKAENLPGFENGSTLRESMNYFAPHTPGTWLAVDRVTDPHVPTSGVKRYGRLWKVRFETETTCRCERYYGEKFKFITTWQISSDRTATMRNTFTTKDNEERKSKETNSVTRFPAGWLDSLMNQMGEVPPAEKELMDAWKTTNGFYDLRTCAAFANVTIAGVEKTAELNPHTAWTRED